MECNKEEAVRAQQIAETKFKARDFNGAKRFAMKALNLNPSLEGLSQMLPVIDVHMISQQTIGNGEKDWYGILQVDPVANDATIKSQYKKLCLLFHPDKNKALGAESAFKLISDAWMVLSDRSKKLLYDSKRKFPRPPNVKANVDEIRSRGQSSGMKPDLRKVETEGGPTLAQLKAEVEKKLKAEKSLQMQKERERLVKESDFILKRRIAAEELKKREREVKKEIHTEKKKMSNLERRKKARGVEPAEADLQNVCNETFEGIQFSSTSERSTQDRSKRLETRFEARAARAQECASPIPKDKVESTHQSADIASINPAASTCLQNDPAKRKKTLSELIGHEAARSKQTTDMESITLEHNLEGPEVEEIPISVLQAESVAPELPCSSSYLHTVRKRPNGSENLPAIVPEVIVQASLKARIREDELAPGEEDFLNVARGTVADENEETRAQGLNNDAKSKIDEDLERDSARARTDMSVRKGKQVFGAEATVNSSCSDHKQVDSRKSYRGQPRLERDDVQAELIEVLPSQFHDFDTLRTRRAFRAGQIWAVYDDKDGMPRFYCRILRVSRSSSSFKAKIVWLEPTPRTEGKNPNSWLKGNKFAIACGEFVAGVESVAQYINIFSHCVSYKLREDPVLIYPLKDEIWAIYLDWMQKLRGNVEGHRDSKNSNQSYELVEILHDYSEKQGVLTARLAKTPGFSAVFHRTGAKQYFSPSQLPAFSHRVLSGKVPKNIKLGITGDAYELDPAGLPESMILGNPSPH
ncbi:hypothetical protein MPTK1_7g15150 [Marchantia polymorpha subsp. ruderalis]|uniref:J domain-containing protein n=2 Tax=Marchantia polymorpha TaxID=3197 RepID=A0AAF6BZS9_MARPO|nr:hypothetical protein MARPO_0009s0199 [Marchantia polymorpha]BBN17513.1 hypothetical protein Mp_7g15150 [Marchantia polymorpha subsp. ruderalis]|eukprot:PTQ47119.1 hypothetical protein MARPO_0009s0199 [Marchantia polymorpha]